MAIDGPAGAGKSTIARLVAGRLGLVRVDTGAIYRAVALIAAERGLTAEAEIAGAALGLELSFEGGRVLVDGRDVTAEIRTLRISEGASRVSAFPMVRAALLDLQRRLGRAHPRGAVLEGRDIGTVVFPDAEVKIFLTASPETRATRRVLELQTSGAAVDYDEVLASIIDRDRRDTDRSVAPLRPAPDAILVDTTKLSLDDVLDEITRIVRERLGSRA